MDRRRATESESVQDRRSRRTAGEGGAVLVEAAFILPVVLLIVFGIIEFGLMFASASTTTSSTRSGARVASATFAPSGDKDAAADDIRDAATEDLSALTNQGVPVDLWIYRADPASTTGAPVGAPAFDSCTDDCYRYSWDGTAFVFDGASPKWPDPDACDTAISPDLDSVSVLVRVTHNFVSGYFVPTRTITEHTTMRLEPLPLKDC